MSDTCACGAVRRFTLEAVVRVVGVTAYLFWSQWQLGLIAVVLVPVFSFASNIYGARSAERQTRRPMRLGLQSKPEPIACVGLSARAGKYMEANAAKVQTASAKANEASSVLHRPDASVTAPTSALRSMRQATVCDSAWFTSPQVAQDAICSFRTVLSFAGEAFEKRRYGCGIIYTP